MIRYLLSIVLMGSPGMANAQEKALDKAMQLSVEQLWTTVGGCSVVTGFLGEDGSVAKSVRGTYDFSWVVPDRVVAGKSETPELKQATGRLLCINADKREVEMVSVGGDGRLWIMTGPLGGEERLYQKFQTAEGWTVRLRFTRFNVPRDAFESRMESTSDGGKNWKPGNHQAFRRVAGSAP